MVPRSSLDVYVHHNPAFSAYCLHWICVGYEADTPKDSDLWIPFIVAMIGLMLLTPDSIRSILPETANGSLSRIFDENPELALNIGKMITFWVDPFWQGVRYGVGRKVLFVGRAGLRSNRTPSRASSVLAEDLRKRGRALGRLLRREGDELGIVTLLGVTAG